MEGTGVDKREGGGALLLHSREQGGVSPRHSPLLRLVEPQFTWLICTEKGEYCHCVRGVILGKEGKPSKKYSGS